MNFKKLLSVVSISLLTIINGHAQTIVPVYWPFSLGGTHAVMVRTMTEEFNAAQKDYQFLFVHKPGAGGSIAANALLTHQGPAILAGTSSFFIRPTLYPAASHDLSKFSTIGSYCDNQPLALLSTKYKTLSELKNNTVNLGVIPGSITHLTAAAYSRAARTDVNTVFYPGTPEMTKDVLGGHLDVSVDFLSSVRQFSGKVNVLGISGQKDYPEGRSFKSQGIANINISNTNFLIYANNTDPDLIKTTRQILAKALESRKIQELCQQEYGAVATKILSTTEASELYTEQVNFWRRQSQGVVIEK